VVQQKTYRATVAYDGTEYSGFQVQPGRATIQGELERVVGRLTQEEVRVHGAGRTDAGVHARGQVISFRSAWRHRVTDLERGMNALLPEDIAVRNVTCARDGFHARFSARSRSYVYNVYESEVRDPARGRFAHRVSDRLDLAGMSRATDALVGRKRFAAFGRPTVGDNTMRRVFSAGWVKCERGCVAWSPAENDGAYQFQIEANGFLRGMVRRLVGTLLEVGLGVRSPEEFIQTLDSQDISTAAPPAPACGLFLWKVCYE